MRSTRRSDLSFCYPVGHLDQIYLFNSNSDFSISQCSFKVTDVQFYFVRYGLAILSGAIAVMNIGSFNTFVAKVMNHRAGKNKFRYE